MKSPLFAITVSAAIGLSAFGSISCKGPYETELPVFAGDEEKFREAVQKLPPADQQDLQGYLDRMHQQKLKTGKGGPYGITIKQALELQAQWKVEEAERQKKIQEMEKLRAEEERKRKAAAEQKRRQMLEICSVDVAKKTYKKGQYGDSFTLDLTFKNHGRKDLVLLKGTLQLYDQSDTLLKEIKIPYSKTLKGGQSATKGGKFPFKPEREGDVKLAKTPLKKLKTKWIPSSYQFKDGTVISVEDPQQMRR